LNDVKEGWGKKKMEGTEEEWSVWFGGENIQLGVRVWLRDIQ
jgi:hypothetical protein